VRSYNPKNQQRRATLKNKNDAIYEKRMKEYKEGNMENRYLQKKKEIIALALKKETKNR
jgi:hypothetical protein